MLFMTKSNADAFKTGGVDGSTPHLQHQAEPLCNRR
jgi:hypothetical protein